MPAPRDRRLTSRWLQHRVEVLEPTYADDGAGGRTVTWPATGSIHWAHVVPLSAGEALIVGTLPRARDTYRITMRRDVAPTASTARLRVVSPSSPPLEILGIRPLEDWQYVEIDAMVAEEV